MPGAARHIDRIHSRAASAPCRRSRHPRGAAPPPPVLSTMIMRPQRQPAALLHHHTLNLIALAELERSVAPPDGATRSPLGCPLLAQCYSPIRIARCGGKADSQCHAPRAARATSKPLKELRAATFSARAETVETKPIFRDAFKRTRCLIPVCGYYPFIAINMRRESIDHVDPRTVAVWSLIGRNLFLITNARVSICYTFKNPSFMALLAACADVTQSNLNRTDFK